MNRRTLIAFIGYYKPYLGLFSAVMACAVVGSSIALAYPLLARYITKHVLEGGVANALAHIYATGAIMLALAVVQWFCNFFVDYRGHKLGAMMERDLRNELFEHYQKLPFSFYDKQRTGKLMSRLTNDLLSVSELYHHGPEDYVIYSIRFVGAFAVLFVIDAKLTLAVFAFLPVLAAFAYVMNRKLSVAFARNKERIADIQAQAEDTLAGIRTVKSFANEEIERDKFRASNERFLESRADGYKHEAYLYNGMQTIVQLIAATVIVFGGVSIVSATLDLADLITFLMYIGYLIEPVQKLTHMTTQYQEGMTGFRRFLEMLGETPEIGDDAGDFEPERIEGRVEFRNVGFKYDPAHDHVLKNVSLTVEPGETVALVGPSGAGKTTFCALIPRFYDACDGEVLLDGVDVKRIRLRSLRRCVGVVQQDVYLFAGTVLDNIRYGKPGASREEVVEAAKLANAHEFIMALPHGYDTDVGQRGVKLSGGQKQRISIARVFLKNPPILVFDEATSALDNESERVVQRSLERLARHRTTFVIAHRLSTVRQADRIVVLTDRGVEAVGTHDELLAGGGTYAKLYRMQFQDDRADVPV